MSVLNLATNLGFDVLVYVILDALAKERVKDDGMNTSDWLQSLFLTFNPELLSEPY